MKKLLFTILTLGSIFGTFAQDDTLVKSSWYGRVMPISICTGAGTVQSKVTQYIEFGKSYGVIDAGLAIGSYSQFRDTTTFAEFKITMDASQYGIFSNEFSLGFGHVFKSNTPIMLEASYTIMAQVHKMWGIGINTGYYDFAGTGSDISRTYYGLFVRYGLLRDMNGGLNRTKMHHRRR